MAEQEELVIVTAHSYNKNFFFALVQGPLFESL